MNKIKIMISGESHKGVFVVEVLVEYQYSVLTVRNECTESVVVWTKWASLLCVEAAQISTSMDTGDGASRYVMLPG